MVKIKTDKESKEINQLAVFIVDAITQRESAIKLTREKNADAVALERSWGLKGDRARAEKNSAKIRSKIALKAAVERWSKSG